MNIQSLEQTLLDAVATCLAMYGFKKNKTQDIFKLYDWGKAAIHLSFIEHHNDFDVTVDVAIRFDLLEDLVNKKNSLLSAKEKKNTFSMGAELGNLKEGKPKRWTITGDTDFGVVAEEIRKCVVETAIPYIEQYCDMRKAIDILAGDDSAAWLHAPIHSERAKRAIALAWLLGGKPLAERMMESKLLFLRNRKDFGLADFESFAKSLFDQGGG